MSLIEPSKAYRPFKYPWAFELYKRQNQVHWLPEEVPLGDDVRDWAVSLTEAERNLVMQIFRLFTKSDIEVANNYHERLLGIFKPTEVKMMLTANAAMESVHVEAYSLLLETIGMPESEYEAFAQYDAMRDKIDHWASFNVDNPAEILKTLAMFGAFAEGLQLFASFAMLMNFPRHNKLKGMGQIVSWSVRDESLHAEGIIKLFHAYAEETGALTTNLAMEIMEMCQQVVGMEDRFIDLAFEMGPVEGLTADDVKAYIRYVADWRLSQLKLPPLYGIEEHPLPWLQALLSGVEHANFFEARATEYSKGASRGTWDEVWAQMPSATA